MTAASSRRVARWLALGARGGAAQARAATSRVHPRAGGPTGVGAGLHRGDGLPARRARARSRSWCCRTAARATPRSGAARGASASPPRAQRFVAMGFAVLVPTRRGYGESGGDVGRELRHLLRSRLLPRGPRDGARPARRGGRGARRAVGRCAPRGARGPVGRRLRLGRAPRAGPSRACVARGQFRRRPRLAGPRRGVRRGAAGRGDGALRPRARACRSSGSTASTTATSAPRSRAACTQAFARLGRHAPSSSRRPPSGLDGHGYFARRDGRLGAARRGASSRRVGRARAEPMEPQRGEPRKFSFEFFPPKTPEGAAKLRAHGASSSRSSSPTSSPSPTARAARRARARSPRCCEIRDGGPRGRAAPVVRRLDARRPRAR